MASSYLQHKTRADYLTWALKRRSFINDKKHQRRKYSMCKSLGNMFGIQPTYSSCVFALWQDSTDNSTDLALQWTGIINEVTIFTSTCTCHSPASSELSFGRDVAFMLKESMLWIFLWREIFEFKFGLQLSQTFKEQTKVSANAMIVSFLKTKG